MSRTILPLFLFAACLAALPARAHPGHEATVGHYLRLRATPGELTVEYAAQVGGLLTQAVWSQIDSDRDGRLSPQEQARYSGSLASGLSLTVDGRPAPLKLSPDFHYPDHDSFFTGELDGIIQVSLAAPLPLGSATHSATLRDETFPGFRGDIAPPETAATGVSLSTPRVTKASRAALIVFQVGPVGAVLDTHTLEAPALGGTAPAAGRGRIPGLALAPNAPDSGEPGRTSPLAGGANLSNAPLFPKGGTVIQVPPAPRRGESELAGLKGFLNRPLSPWVVVLGLAAAVFAGMAHALTPGHGKTMVAAYLVGSRGTVWDAVVLGLVVTLTHTGSVYILGLLCLWLTASIRAEIVAQWLGVVSAVLVLGMGFWLLMRGLLAYYGVKPLPGHSHGPGGHTHSHGLEHTHADVHAHEQSQEAAHEHTHAHASEAPLSGSRRPPRDAPLEEYPAGTPAAGPDRWGIIGLGVAGGMVPCTDALAILLAAVHLGSIGIGLALIAAFSLGMAVVLVTIGVLMVTAKGLMKRFTGSAPWVRALPAISGAILFVLGMWLTFQSLAQAGALRGG